MAPMTRSVDDEPTLNRTQIRARQKALRQENGRWADHLREVPMDQWPDSLKAAAVRLDGPSVPLRAWRSKRFAAVLYDEGTKKPHRLSVNRAQFDDAGAYVDGITWDELMQVKRECGFGQRDALELYPADRTVVNVVNMRHLWMVDAPSILNWNR